ncbi:hypothetical protein EDD86DRAFT_211520 [Gorgonomyces haynaldii]|nr:hypothetical protein EDD86DRAFT_211520 [Gorgonomyces haynaldii]
MLIPTTGDTKYFWTTAQPPWYYTSNPMNGPWQMAELLITIVNASIYLFVAGHNILQFRHRPTVAGSFLLTRSLLGLSLMIMYVRATYFHADSDTANVTAIIATYCSGFSSLASLLYTATFICILQELRRSYAIAIYVFVILVHFIVAGEIYVQFLWDYMEDSIRYGLFSHTFLFAWIKWQKYYKIFTYLWDTLPAPIMFLKLAHNRTGSLRKSILYIYKEDKWFYLVILTRIVLIVSNYLIDHIEETTTLLQNDMNVMSYWSLTYLVSSLSLLTQIYALESVKKSITKTSKIEFSSMQSQVETITYKKSDIVA